MGTETSHLDSVRSIRAGLVGRKVSAREVVGHFLDRIGRYDDSLHAFRETYDEQAMAHAAALDERIAAGGAAGPLAGVPVALKDNIVTSFGTSCAGSRILEGFRSPYSGTVVERLIDAGAIIIGKTNCDEFAMGSSTEHCAYGGTRNPWDPERVPGGSSGGSAAAVASGLCPAALGSDTGGSIRQPAALCGVVGMKPSYGRVSRWGLIAFASSLDQIGPITSSVGDAAILYQAIAGFDPRDSTSADEPVGDVSESIDEPIRALRVGIPRAIGREENDPGVVAAVDRAIDVLRDLGANIVEIDLSLADSGIATYYIIAPAEASSNLARYDGVRYGRRAAVGPQDDLEEMYARSRAEGFGPEVQRRIMLGTYVLSAGYYDAYYKRAQQVRRLIRDEYDRAFERCDVIVGPTTPTPAFRRGEIVDPLAMYLNDYYTVNANIAGICAMSVPAGFADLEGAPLPVGVQLQCRAFDEQTLFRVGRMLEAAVDGPRRPAAFAVDDGAPRVQG